MIFATLGDDEQPVIMSDGLIDALDDILSWYGDILPRILDQRAFPQFAVRSREFAHQIVSDDVPVVLDPKAETAYTDGKTITLPALYLMPEFYDYLGIPAELHTAAACLLINYAQVHEALHILLSIFGMDNFVKGNTKAEEYIMKYKGFAACLNMIEDVFIEEYCREHFFQVASFISGGGMVLFSEHHLGIHLQEINKEGGNPNLDQLLGLIAFAKATHNRNNPNLAVIEDFMVIMDKARDFMLSPLERVEIAVELFEALMEEGESQGMGEGERQDTDFMKDPNGAPQEFDAESIINAIQKTMEDLGITAEQLAEAIEAFSEEMEKAEAQDAIDAGNEDGDGEPEEDEDKKTSDKVKKFRDAFGYIPPVIVCDIMQARQIGTKTIAPSREWVQFGNHLRYTRQLKTSPGVPTDKGGKLVKTRLHRIATDNKVLAHRNYKQVKRGKPEVILLIDSSGSMEYHSGQGDDNLFITVIKAGYGMYEALMRAGISVAVYAHTSSRHSEAFAPMVYPVAAFRMPMMSNVAISHGDYGIRFNRLARLDCNENFDGLAVQLVSKQFSKTEGTKLLIVLSDGSPHGGQLYSGTPANNHTKAVAENCRDNGINVVSISLVPSVVSTNDKIYGAEFNLRGFGPELDKSLQELARRIAIQ